MAAADIPFCVDLDGTLLDSDLLVESLLDVVGHQPLTLCMLPLWLISGKAALKARLAERSTLDVTTLPYSEAVLNRVRAARAAGRTTILCTASDQLLAERVASHLGVFDSVLASDGIENLAGERKARRLVKLFGERGFDYVGNADVDVAVWSRARGALVIGSLGLALRAAAVSDLIEHIESAPRIVSVWLRALRIHQWLKNLLVLLPLFAAHRVLDVDSAVSAMTAFAAFSLCASGVYLINDLLDLQADRRHLGKRHRPFASGRLPLHHGLLAAILLTLTAFTVALWVSTLFAVVQLGYWLTTLAYSLRLKRVVMLDVMLLAALYTARIIGGAVAIKVTPSFWLLAFSMFMFLSLALLKRYTELAALLADGLNIASGRGYRVDDLPLLHSLGAASGYGAVLVLALYINSPESLALYARSYALWLLCPLLLFWISRAWLVAHRGGMHDDPVIYAATDRDSLIIAALGGLVLLAAL
ncbi:MAG: UbiA family prenyltransferase [Pseudomarimonas sp.]